MNQAVAALRRGDVAQLTALLAREPPFAHKAQLIVDAARGARLDVLKLLVKHGADPNAHWRGYRPLHALIQEQPHKEPEPSRDRLECLDWLLEHGADPEQLGAWPPARAILVAAFTGIGPFVARLRKGGARVDAVVGCALGDVAAVRRALGKDPGFATSRDAGGITVLQCCAASRLGRGDPEVHRALLQIATLLLDSGADPNAKTKSWSHDVDAAYFAISARGAALLELLLARGADATAALPSAVWNETDEFAEIVLRHGADVNRAVAEGRPLLSELVRWGQVRPALWLLEHGADPNLPDDRGWTAVHQAASRGNARMLSAVLQAGGDPRRKDRRGETPFDVAVSKGRHELATVLRSKR